MRFYLSLAIFVCLMIVTAGCGDREAKLRADMEKMLKPANVPSSVQNGVDAPDLKQDGSNVVTISGASYYWGQDQYPVDVIMDKAKRYFAANPGKTVDVQADHSTDYGNVVEVLDQIRRGGGKDVALLVRSENNGPLKRFPASIHPEPGPDVSDDTSIPDIKLVKDGKVTIGKKEMGTIDTVNQLTDSLRSTGTRTVNIRAPKGGRYADVIKLADAAKSGGSSQVFLVIDDLVD